MDNNLSSEFVFEPVELLGNIEQGNQQVIDFIEAQQELFGEIAVEDIQLDVDMSETASLFGELEEASLLEGELSIANEVETYDGKYKVTPKTSQQELNTKFKYMIDNVKIFAIPYFEVGNNEGGTTVYIADNLEME